MTHHDHVDLCKQKHTCNGLFMFYYWYCAIPHCWLCFQEVVLKTFTSTPPLFTDYVIFQCGLSLIISNPHYLPFLFIYYLRSIISVTFWTNPSSKLRHLFWIGGSIRFLSQMFVWECTYAMLERILTWKLWSTVFNAQLLDIKRTYKFVARHLLFQYPPLHL